MELINVTKQFNQTVAVDQLSFKVSPGEVFGLIGQNGAGKTTTFRMILNLITPTTGQILWNDRDINKVDLNSIGYLPEERGLYPKLSVEDQILLFGKLRGKSKVDLKKDIEYWLERFNLQDKRKALTDTLSKGNQQKVQLITSIIHRPSLLILDEPFSGFDPVNAKLLKEAIFSLKESGTTIIFSSHRMDHVEELCDNLCLLKGGNSLFSGSINNLKESYGKVNLTIKGSFTIEELKSLYGVKDVKKSKDTFKILLSEEKFAEGIFNYVTKKGFIEQFSLDYLSLEDIFMKRVGGINV